MHHLGMTMTLFVTEKIHNKDLGTMNWDLKYIQGNKIILYYYKD